MSKFKKWSNQVWSVLTEWTWTKKNYFRVQKARAFVTARSFRRNLIFEGKAWCTVRGSTLLGSIWVTGLTRKYQIDKRTSLLHRGMNCHDKFYSTGREYLRGKYHCTISLLFDWFGISCMAIDNFCFYLQNRVIQTSKQEVNGTVILPLLVFPGTSHNS